MTKILIVEDEVVVASEIQIRLEKLGYKVLDIVTNGEKAVQLSGKLKPDLVLMDIKLTGDIDGIEAANQIKKRFNIPVIYITAYGDKETLQRAKVTEPYGYIIKPFEVKELHSNIEIALYKYKTEKELAGHRLHLEKLVEERTHDIVKINEQLKQEINGRIKAENAAIRAKENLQNIIDSASEIIISIDNDGKVRTWNNSAEILTGYSRGEIIGKHITKLSVFDMVNGFISDINNIPYGKKPWQEELVVKTKNNESKILKVSYSLVRDDDKVNAGILLIGNDITSLSETHGKLIKGGSYLILNEDNKFAMDLFLSLSNIEYKGLLITRPNPELVKNRRLIEKIKLILLSQEKLQELENIETPDRVITTIREFSEKNPNSLILLDGIHFLLTRFSFKELTNILYNIIEIVSLHNSIFLLCLDPALLDDKQLAVVKHELQPLPSHRLDNLVIGDELFDILVYVSQNNIANSLISIKDLLKRFSIVYRTAKKRLKVLEDSELLIIKKYGKSKALFVTEKGKKLLSRRQIA